MKRYLIASDIHGSSHYTKKLLAAFEQESCQKLILLGDILYHGPRNPLPSGYNCQEVANLLNEYSDCIIAVRGNCDAKVDELLLDFDITAESFLMEIDGRSFYFSHGDVYNKDNLPKFFSKGDVLVNGHFHIAELGFFNNDKNFYLNPGSVAIPKNNLGCSFAILEGSKVLVKNLDTGNVLFSLDFNEAEEELTRKKEEEEERKRKEEEEEREAEEEKEKLTAEEVEEIEEEDEKWAEKWREKQREEEEKKSHNVFINAEALRQSEISSTLAEKDDPEERRRAIEALQKAIYSNSSNDDGFIWQAASESPISFDDDLDRFFDELYSEEEVVYNLSNERESLNPNNLSFDSFYCDEDLNTLDITLKEEGSRKVEKAEDEEFSSIWYEEFVYN